MSLKLFFTLNCLFRNGMVRCCTLSVCCLFLLLCIGCTSSEKDSDSFDREAILSAIDTLIQRGKTEREAIHVDEALRLHDEAFRYSELIHDTLRLMKCCNQLATDYRRRGMNVEASGHLTTALTLSALYSGDDSIATILERAKSLNGFGNIYLDLGYYDEAESYFRSSLEIDKRRYVMNESGMAMNYSCLGRIYEALEKFDSARSYYELSITSNLKMHNVVGLSLVRGYNGRISEKEHRYQDALSYYMLSYRSLRGKADVTNIIEPCTSMGRVYMLLNQYDSAYCYLQEALRASVAIGNVQKMSTVHLLLGQYYEEKGNLKDALRYYHLGQQYRDSVQNDSQENQIRMASVKYEQAKRLKDVERLEAQNMAEQNLRQRTVYLSFALVLILLLIIGFMYFAFYMRGRRAQLASQVEQVRTTFFTNITHEFRTPLTVILGLAGQLKSTEVNQDTRLHYIDSIMRQGEQLLDLINQLLGVSRLMAGKGPDVSDWKHGNLLEYLRIGLDAYVDYARLRQVTLNTKFPATPIEMDFVPEYCAKILRNLMSNAFKYTPIGGQIVVAANIENGEVHFSVTNTGSTLPAKDIEHIFDLFYTGRNSTNSTGTGVGLPYVRQMLEMVHGRITASNLPGGFGVVFNVYMPLECKEHKGKIETWERPEEVTYDTGLHTTEFQTFQIQDGQRVISTMKNNVNRHKVMVVEDNVDIADYMKLLLHEQYEVEIAFDAYDALNCIETERPDVLITDVMMPGMNGFELCRLIRNNKVMHSLPIIFVTACEKKEQQEEGMKAGGDAYLVKPFNADELKSNIARLILERHK